LPAHLFDRPKKGFGVPLSSWLNGPLKEWVADCTDARRVSVEGYLSPREVAKVVEHTKSGKPGYAEKLWAICIFQSWLKDVHDFS
jgi:asparagine synthase (glutamine-hydrolysing)